MDQHGTRPPAASAAPGTPGSAARAASLLAPGSVAVVGSFRHARSPAARVLANLRRYHYPHRLEAVDVDREAPDPAGVWNRWRQSGAVPEHVIAAVSTRRLAGLLPHWSGVRAVTVFSAPSSQEDPAVVERVLADLADTGVVVCGPNCQGVANLYGGFVGNFSTTFESGAAAAGPVAVVAQSGLIGGLLAQQVLALGLGAGYLVSTGNEAGLKFGEAIGHVLRDERIRVVVAYIESIRDPQALRLAMQTAHARGQHVLAIKAGRSPAGAGLSRSHTNALAGPDLLCQALLEDLGILRCRGIAELCDAVQALLRCKPLPAGPLRVAAVSNSGGLNVLLADELHQHGLPLADPQAGTAAAIERALGPQASAPNPVDVGALSVTRPAVLAEVSQALVQDDGVAALLVCIGGLSDTAGEVASGLAAVASAAGKPVIACWDPPAAADGAVLREAGVALYPDLARAVQALGHLDRSRQGAPAHHADVADATARLRGEQLARGLSGLGKGHAREADVLQVLREAGFPALPLRVAGSVEQALAAAQELGYPVAVKIDCAQIAHKAAAGCVRLGIGTPADLAHAYRQVLLQGAQAWPRQPPAAVLIEPMVAAQSELLVGLRRDAVLGPFVVLGTGGVLVELIDDKAVRPAPVSVRGALDMLAGLRGRRLLPDAPGLALEVAGLVAAVSWLGASLPALCEFDLNPVLVRADGGGFALVDALASLE
jgi:acetate---CoA ligase (ADP-forming)